MAPPQDKRLRERDRDSEARNAAQCIVHISFLLVIVLLQIDDIRQPVPVKISIFRQPAAGLVQRRRHVSGEPQHIKRRQQICEKEQEQRHRQRSLDRHPS